MERHRDLRDAREGLHQAPPRRSATTCAARTPASPPTPALAYFRDARRHGGRATADPPHRRRGLPRTTAALSNYWGYSSIGYFAPHALYAATGTRGEQVREFKGMVKALHRAGIEVILDVVYNHTAEGNHLGPMLSFRGLDNRSYYRLMPDEPRFYMDFTGTGNSLNPVHPSVLRLIMDSLRYWVLECHVDGFRFDLASALAREFYDVDRLSAVLRHHPPGPGPLAGEADRRAVGRRAGRLPGRQLPGALGRVEREVPRLGARLLARPGQRRRVRAALHGLLRPVRGDGRDPFASINFVTAHDGFTLRDLVSYNEKHNEANLEDNRDGTDDNRSWNSAPRARPTTRPCSRCGRGSSGTSSRHCCSRRACRCCSAATSSGGRRAATTTRGARTTRSRGSTGRAQTASCWSSRAG